MKEEGPLLEALTRRLAECPAEFLAEPRDSSGDGDVDVAAVVYDLLRDLGGAPLAKEQLALFELKNRKSKEERNRIRVALVASWLLHDPWFRYRSRFAAQAFAFLTDGIKYLASLVSAEALIADPDRREELARLCCKALGLRPAGESPAQAEDRLATLDSVERSRVVREARAAEERARQIREELARKAAEEAAAVYGRE
jgi:hypothetical protein